MASEKIINRLDDKLDEKQLVESANKICNGIPSTVDENSKSLSKGLFAGGKVFYFNPTEELRICDFVKNGDSVATVLGSCDFAIDSIFHGASDVLTFDINRFQYYPAMLKFKFLQNMPYDDYCSFFTDEDNECFLSKDMYEYLKMISSDNKDFYIFMDIFFNKLSNARLKVREDVKSDPFYNIVEDAMNDKLNSDSIYKKLIKLFRIKIDDDSTDMYLNFIFDRFGLSYSSPEILQLLHGIETNKFKNSYLENEYSYNLVKEILKDANIDFINSDISELVSNLKKVGYIDSSFKGFNSIYLSNVPEYIDGAYFVDVIIKRLSELLKDDGVIVYCCQGLSNDSLKRGKSSIDRIIYGSDNFISDSNPLNKIRLRNNINAYCLLRSLYDVSLDETKSLCLENGYEDSDSFVYVRKSNYLK